MPVSVCVNMCACVYSLAFVCTFPLLTGWLAAVLESLLTESVGSAGYFYPLACVREQVEALWATTRSHGDDRRYAAICGCTGQTSRSECPFYKDTACGESFTGRIEAFISKTQQSIIGGEKKLILKKDRTEVFFYD